ncbi:hypothetical protein GCM10009555_050630 [Acrocarpospora macrocephala]|uniref:DUF4351 domain-containing protein n=1 Tax=Acrocarpospora macrocephala TaxID=150177 RepID=A0A5M3X4Y0_9ACTN|nr:hypothetical protein [Acrocarpospora macrocephala]GES16214.1 hypothetical protein Amac_098120 [Acrocarpospora macrocephala]
MVSATHEGLIGIATLDPGRTAHALRTLFELSIPSTEDARIISGDITQRAPTEYRADAAILYGTKSDRLGVIVEVQLHTDQHKRISWPACITSLRARDKCPTCLVVICQDRATATWAATPIEIGHPGLTLVPLVIGPDNTPVITDLAEAISNIGLAAISAITHNNHPEIDTILRTFTEALATIDPDTAPRYAEYVTTSLTGPAQKEMERLMATQSFLYQHEYAQKLLAEGKAEGKAEGAVEKETRILLMMVETREITLSEDERQRILECGDETVLDSWVKRAMFADSAKEIFED